MENLDKYKKSLDEIMHKEIVLIRNIHELENKKLKPKDILGYIGSVLLIGLGSFLLLGGSSTVLALLIPVVYAITVPSCKTIIKFKKLKKNKKLLASLTMKEKELKSKMNTMPKFEDNKIYNIEEEKNYTLPILKLDNFHENIESKPYVYVKRK